MSEPRPTVQRFAEMMEAALAEHDAERGVDGWKDSPAAWLFRRLQEEVAELGYEIWWRDKGGQAELGKECADVANFAMMIADRLGGIE